MYVGWGGGLYLSTGWVGGEEVGAYCCVAGGRCLEAVAQQVAGGCMCTITSCITRTPCTHSLLNWVDGRTDSQTDRQALGCSSGVSVGELLCWVWGVVNADVASPAVGAL